MGAARGRAGHHFDPAKRPPGHGGLDRQLLTFGHSGAGQRHQGRLLVVDQIDHRLPGAHRPGVGRHHRGQVVGSQQMRGVQQRAQRIDHRTSTPAFQPSSHTGVPTPLLGRLPSHQPNDHRRGGQRGSARGQPSDVAEEPRRDPQMMSLYLRVQRRASRLGSRPRTGVSTASGNVRPERPTKRQPTMSVRTLLARPSPGAGPSKASPLHPVAGVPRDASLRVGFGWASGMARRRSCVTQRRTALARAQVGVRGRGHPPPV
jgi:hypothetical protein